MATSTVFVRCPSCGGELRITLSAQPPTQWFPCPHCRVPVPVVVPRDPPPLYSWEVLPGLYPALARPRVPRWRVRRAVAVALVVVAVLTASFAGVLVYDAWVATRPAAFTVNGAVDHEVRGVVQPLVGAQVILSNDANRSTTVFTKPDGSFSFTNVPPGGVSLNVTATGFAPQTVTTFVSSVYVWPATGLDVLLAPGGPGNGSAIALAPFPDLEQFVASVGGGAILFGIIALVAGVAAVATVREDRPALGVVGGVAGVLSPLVLVYLALATAIPFVMDGAAVAAGAGVFVVSVRAIQLAQTGPAAGPG